MANQSDADDGIDFSKHSPTFVTEVRSNNETVKLYGTHPDGGEFGAITHQYDGFPAQGLVAHDVVGWQITDVEIPDSELPDDVTEEEALDEWRDEYREWVQSELFSESRDEGHVAYPDTHTITIENPFEGDVITVELETENKRRLR